MLKVLDGVKAKSAVTLQPRLRVRVGQDIALGPGKVELLELVERTGSIMEASRQIGMSYMRAWTLIQTMNRCFKEPLVVAERGGSKKGGARLTDTGTKALALYHEMIARSLKTTLPNWRQLQKLLAP